MRLSASIDALRRELEGFRKAERHEEDHRKEANAIALPATQASSEPARILSTALDVGAPPSSEQAHDNPGTIRAGGELDGNFMDDGNERSMELATPLQPTIISLRDDLTDNEGSHLPDPRAIPLPDSPSPRSNVSMPDSLLAPLPPPSPPPQPQPADERALPADPRGTAGTNARIVHIERELALARQELEDKDRALHELRAVVEGLRPLVERHDGGTS
ncbi:hypothetical protein B0H21DRAFT_546211 [Amylocystis lapponica]|nr:hypothetical protein B0H21DRAFT_546211 [Amylocystis lapponica]